MRIKLSCGFFISIATLFILKSAFCAQKSEYELERIVVSKKSHLPGSQNIGYEKFEDFPANTPVEALRYSHVDLQSRQLKGGIQTDYSLRGSSFQDVLVLLDGQRINDPQTGHFNADIPLTKEDIESISVMPGASSALFGPDAIGGAINFQVKKPRENKTVLELNGGSFNTAGGTLSITRKIDLAGLRFSCQREVSSGFRYDTDFKRLVTDFTSSLDLPNGEFLTIFGYEEKEFGAFDFYTPGLNYPSKEWTRTYLVNSGLDLIMPGFSLKPNFLWRRHFDKFALDKTQVRSTYLNYHRNESFTPNVYLQKESELLGKMGAGAEYGWELISSTNLGKHNRQHKSVYLDDSKELLTDLLLASSFRFDHYQGFGRILTGSLNLKYEFFNQYYLGAGVSRNMRLPSFTELYYNDPTTVGNSGLSAEKSINYQIEAGHSQEKLSTGLVVFFRQERDMIDWIKRDPAQTKFQVDNITKDYVYGAESHLKFQLNKLLDIDLGYTYLNKYIFDEGFIYKYGQNYINHLVNSVFDFNLPFGRQALCLTYKKKPNRAGWMLVDTRLAYDFNKYSHIFFNITNLLNTKYEEIVGITQPGRSIEGGLRFDW